MRARSTSTRLFLVIALVTVLAGVASAAVNGAIYTTTPTGTTVNGNIYASKDLVYLSGGPQNMKDPGLSPSPGFYYFQVTDPSGSVLLSTDDITCRVVWVNNGRVAGIPGTGGSDPTAGGYGNPACYHTNGTLDDANGALPVQLCSASGCPSGPPPGTSALSYYDTPNPGGEYKAWMTPVGDYSGGTNNCSQPSSHQSFGFCDSDSKTDNFKVKPANVTSIVACKFIDVDGDHTYDPLKGDYFVAGWPFTATVNGTTIINQSTGQDGCTEFDLTIAKGSTDTVLINEDLPLDNSYTQVAPIDCSTLDNGGDTSVVCTVNPDGTVTLGNINLGDTIVAPLFGNALGQNLVALTVSKTAVGSNTFNWTIAKSATQTQIDTTSGSATFTYTVNVTHDAGTGWMVTGNISVTNPNGTTAIGLVNIHDAIDNGGQCSVNGGPVNGDGSGDYAAGTIGGGVTISVPYTCTFTTNPGSGTNTVSVTWDPAIAGGGPSGNSAAYDFTSANTTATVTDSLGGNLGTATIKADNSTSCAIAASGFTGVSGTLSCPAPSGATASFTYQVNFPTDPVGTCTQHNNTASFTTNTNSTATNSNTVTVTQCVGEDLTVSKTAAATFTAGLNKSVNKTTVQQSGGNITFNYTVNLTSPTFMVTGTITVSNPNDWESITANVADTIDSGGTCVVTGGSGITIAALGSSGALPYTCTYTANPTLVTGTNTATVTETGTLDTGATDPNKGGPGIVPGTPKPGTAAYTFPTQTITDSVQSSYYFPTACTATLGTVSATTTTASAASGCPGGTGGIGGVASLASPKWGTFTYSITDANSNPGTCTSYNNTATITGGSSSNLVTVTVCNTGTGALTMGFWKGPNGQKVIKASCGGTSGTSLTAYLDGFNPFKDDTATTCSGEATYVYNIINGASCTSSSKTCNTMLRAQMLATALDVYFSTPGLGGNQIGAYNGLGSKTPPLGGIAIDLSHICSMADGSSGSSCTGVYEDARYEFGIVTTGGCLGTTVGQMLSYSNFPSSVNGNPVATANTGALWYYQGTVQNKGKQVFAKDGFDDTNNQIANISPPAGSCSSTF
jgi:hypothetical protein